MVKRELIDTTDQFFDKIVIKFSSLKKVSLLKLGLRWMSHKGKYSIVINLKNRMLILITITEIYHQNHIALCQIEVF